MSFPLSAVYLTEKKVDDVNKMPRNLQEEGSANFKYVSLSNGAESIYSNDSKLEEIDEQKNTDQKLPDTASKQKSSGFYYVNKSGFVQSVKPKSMKFSEKNTTTTTTTAIQSKTDQKANQLICTNLILEVYKNNKDAKVDEKRVSIDQALSQEAVACHRSENRSVPDEMHPCNSFSTLNASSAGSLMERDNSGNILINTNLTIEEPYIEISHDHVKYINLFSILCCWCFPITGLVALFYSRLTKKYYDMRDMPRAKKFLNRSEWMLMLTFFFGLTFIALGFAILETNLFKSANSNIFSHRNLIH